MTGAEVTQWAQAAAVVLAAIVFGCLTVTYKPFVLRLNRSGQMLSDPSGWTVMLFNDTLWLAHFGEAWRQQYGSTWAVGWKRKHVWFYTPKGDGKHGTDKSD